MAEFNGVNWLTARCGGARLIFEGAVLPAQLIEVYPEQLIVNKKERCRRWPKDTPAWRPGHRLPKLQHSFFNEL